MSRPKLLSLREFSAIQGNLEKTLTEGLEAELKGGAWQADPDSDLWDLPTVDSKTVCKLSPIVEKVTGHKLKAKWVRKGGYPSIAEAVSDLISHIAQDCVTTGAASVAAE